MKWDRSSQSFCQRRRGRKVGDASERHGGCPCEGTPTLAASHQVLVLGSLADILGGEQSMKMAFALYSFMIGLLFSTSFARWRLASAQDDTFQFNVTSSSNFDCSTTLICVGGPHKYAGGVDGSFAGDLTLLNDSDTLKQQSAAVVYYRQPVRILDQSTGRSASFSTNFTTEIVMETWNLSNHALDMRGDGMTFVMSADNATVGTAAKCLGIYDGSGRRSSKTIVVELDSWQNAGAPVFDISDNHVSFDFMTIAPVASANASDVGIQVWYPGVKLYTWIAYNAQTQQLEVRINRNESKPSRPLLGHKVNLFDVAEEYMWVGFSTGNGDAYSSYYISEWMFESSGIPLRSVVQMAKTRSRVGTIVAIAIGVPFLLAIGGLAALFIFRRMRAGRLTLGSPSFNEDPMLELQQSGIPESFSYKQLSVATRAFSEESKLGQGGFGSVYRGVLPTSGTPIAVKRISADSKQGAREFVAEVSIISQLRHRNLIQLIGWCKDRGKYLLVYELMPNGSLDKALFRPAEQPSTLSWSQRFNIVTGTAAALDYLHQGWKQQVIHRDVKASNIMLDNEWNAKLGDFGLARLVDHQGPAATTLVAGTYGYIAPEAATSGRFTDKTDVFAFGAVVLEIACGRKAVSAVAPADEMVLVDWVWQRLSEGDLLSVVDRRLGDYDTYWMEVVLLMGLLCSHPNPLSRPTIRHVVQVLAGDAPVPSVPLSKPAAVFRTESQRVSIDDLYNSRTNTTTASRLTAALSGSYKSSRNSSFFSRKGLLS